MAAGLQAAILLVVLGGAYVSAALAVRRAIDESLVRHALLDGGRERLPPGVIPEAEAEARARRVGAAFRTLIERHEDGEEHDDPDERHLVPRPRPDWLELLLPDEGAVRVAYVARPDGQVRVVAAPAGALAREMGEVVRTLAGVAAAAVPVAAALVFWVARRAFAPLREVASTAAAIGPASLDTRIRPRVAAEDETVASLVAVLNGMLDRLQAGFRAQARFADDAAHELRTPLGALRTQLEVALRHPRDAETYRQVLANALEDVERLSRLADDLLLLARHERGAVLPVESAVPLGDLVARAESEVSGLAHEAGVAVLTDVPAGLDLDCDPVAVERVLANLLRNAVQHSPPGGVVTVTARARAAAPAESGDGSAVPGVEVHVEDEGPGIPPADLPFVFDRFYRGDAARRRAGTGLGLAIARAVVEAHGGRIAASSRPGGGARFTVWLPRRAAPFRSGHAAAGQPD